MHNNLKKIILIPLVIYSFIITLLFTFWEKNISLHNIKSNILNFVGDIYTMKAKIVTNFDIWISCEKNNISWNYLVFSSYETMNDVWTSLFITGKVPKQKWKEKREKKECFVFNYGNDKKIYDYERFANKYWYFKVQDTIYHYDEKLWFSTWWIYTKNLKFDN